jgi:hypothetical protein
MSSIRITIPKLRLTDQLRMPGGAPVAEALESAAANLATLKPDCLRQLQALVTDTATAFENISTKFDAESLRRFYHLASGGVGTGVICGSPAIDRTLVSLCNLLDRLITKQYCNREAIGVHVATLRMLVSAEGLCLDNAAQTVVLEGLKKVSDRFAPGAERCGLD